MKCFHVSGNEDVDLGEDVAKVVEAYLKRRGFEHGKIVVGVQVAGFADRDGESHAVFSATPFRYPHEF
jgi:hypothetical protein